MKPLHSIDLNAPCPFVRMYTLFCIILFISIAVNSMVYSQDSLGLFSTNGITEKEWITYSLDDKQATLMVTSPVKNITVFNRGIETRPARIEDSLFMFVLPPGPGAITVRAPGYRSLALDEYRFRKNRVYDLIVEEIKAPLTPKPAAGFGAVRISTIPQGAKLTVNGIPGEWKTPAEVQRLPQGTYTFTVVKERYDSVVFNAYAVENSTVEISPVTLPPQFGYLAISVDPSAYILIDGMFINNAANSVIELPRGKYQLELQKSRYQTIRKEITIGSGDTLRLRPMFVLNRSFVNFSTLPALTKIYVDGRAVSRSLVEVESGDHTIRISCIELGDKSRKITIQPGDTINLTEGYFQEPGSVTVFSDVPADLYINGQPYQLGTLNLNFIPGYHKIRLAHENGEEEKTIRLYPNESKVVFIPVERSQTVSMLLTAIPGGNQFYNGMTTKGLLYFSSFALSIAGSYYLKSEYDRQYDSYMNIVNEYRQTKNALRARELHSIISTTYPKVTTKQDQQKLAYGITGTIFLWNIIDLFLFEPEFGSAQQQSGLSSIGIQAERDQMSVNLNVIF